MYIHASISNEFYRNAFTIVNSQCYVIGDELSLAPWRSVDQTRSKYTV